MRAPDPLVSGTPPLASGLVRRRVRASLILGLVGALAGCAIGSILSVVDGNPPIHGFILGGVTGLLVGTGMGLSEEFAMPWLARRMAYWPLMWLREVVYGVLVFGTLATVSVAELLLRGVSLPDAFPAFWFSSGLRDLIVSIVVAALLGVGFQIRRLLYPRDLWHLISGRYHYPVPEERMFLFADLVDSTGIAEQLGHVEYSHLISDMFAHLTEPILAWRGIVYQFVGDGVIITWPTRVGAEGAAPVHCFFEMEYALGDRRGYYEERYGLVPRIRGGAHVGPVVATWVGTVKMELAFHGDTINATARLQDLAKSFDAQLVVSQELLDASAPLYDLEVELRGEIPLKGREAPVLAHTVRPPATASVLIP